MSTRGTILDNLATALAAITTANGYATTVREVLRDVPHTDDLVSEYATITILDTGSDTVRGYCASGKVRSLMHMTLVAKIPGTTRGNPSVDVDNMIGSIRKAVLAPISLGSNVRFVEIVDIPRIAVADRQAVIGMDLDIDYWYTGSAP